MDPHTIDLLVSVFVACLASTGFWTIIQKKMDRKNSTTQLVLGLAHDRIVTTGKYYIKRGHITTDEYQNFYQYLYEPYSRFGGNGLAEKIKEGVDELPMVSGNYLGIDVDEFNE